MYKNNSLNERLYLYREPENTVENTVENSHIVVLKSHISNCYISLRLPLQKGTKLSQYPLIWPVLASHVTFSAPSKLCPSLQLILHVDPYELSQSPTINPFTGGNNVWHLNTVVKYQKD